MQQDTAEMQGTGKLPKVRSFPFGSYETNIHNVEKLIIDKYLGIPYKHRGRTLEGLDCWGFLKLIYQDLGFSLFDIEDLTYEKTWAVHGNDYFKLNSKNDWIKNTTPQVLDGVLFLNNKGIANHAGVILKNRKFIHAARCGIIISRLNDRIWRERIEGFYRLRERRW